jgi:hypothetical protein
LPKISGKLPSARFFQPPTWVGWTPNICAIWAAVLCLDNGREQMRQQADIEKDELYKQIG